MSFIKGEDVRWTSPLSFRRKTCTLLFRSFFLATLRLCARNYCPVKIKTKQNDSAICAWAIASANRAS